MTFSLEPFFSLSLSLDSGLRTLAGLLHPCKVSEQEARAAFLVHVGVPYRSLRFPGQGVVWLLHCIQLTLEQHGSWDTDCLHSKNLHITYGGPLYVWFLCICDFPSLKPTHRRSWSTVVFIIETKCAHQ